MTRERFLNAAKILLNIDKDELEAAGVIKPGAVGGSDWTRFGSDWTRFNDDPLIFLVKLPDDRYARLWEMIEARQPKLKVSSPSATAETLIRIKDRLSDRAERDAINEAVAAIYKLEEVSA